MTLIYRTTEVPLPLPTQFTDPLVNYVSCFAVQFLCNFDFVSIYVEWSLFVDQGILKTSSSVPFLTVNHLLIIGGARKIWTEESIAFSVLKNTFWWKTFIVPMQGIRWSHFIVILNIICNDACRVHTISETPGIVNTPSTYLSSNLKSKILRGMLHVAIKHTLRKEIKIILCLKPQA